MNRKIKNIRKSKNLKVRDIAKVLDISESFYYKIEQGSRTPRLELAKQICGLYGASLEELF